MSIYNIQEIIGLEMMLEQLPLLQELTPELTATEAKYLLEDMIDHHYRMFGVFDNEKCVAISGVWMTSKLYSGKYLEIDNFVTDKNYRSKGVGKLLLDYLEGFAKENKCKHVMLDAYVTNPPAHKFYLREGFIIKGFHFLKAVK